MSNEGFKGVPGVPDGYELLAIRHAEPGEWFIDPASDSAALAKIRTTYKRPIIRKIEVPKQYRAFANGAEYIAKRRDAITVDWKSSFVIADITGFFAVVSANNRFVWVAFGKDVEVFEWQQAFERLVFRHINGTTSPFGVEVTSE